MKLTDIKNPLTEAKVFDGNFVFTKKTVDKLARELYDQDIPEKFTLSVMIDAANRSLDVEYELDSKKINDSKGHHQVEFNYEFTMKTISDIRALMKEYNNVDEENDLYDKVEGDLPPEEISLIVELGKQNFQVYGHAVLK